MHKDDFWEDAKRNAEMDSYSRAYALIEKYGFPINEDVLEEKDWYEYDAIKDVLPEIQKEYAKLKIGYQYGDATAKELDNYLYNYTLPDRDNVNAGLAAANDMIRNYKTMTKMKLKESDPFFHCKANYEAASRGLKGVLVA